MNNYKWDGQDIKEWANHYLMISKSSMNSLEKILYVSHSTIWWCFKHRLYEIDPDLYDKVLEKLNKSKRGHR